MIKPCHKLGFCPYGVLVEEFPLEEPRNEKSCKVFGHTCPVFSYGEELSEFGKEQIEAEINSAPTHQLNTEENNNGSNN